jgi:hypothetical protein
MMHGAYNVKYVLTSIFCFGPVVGIFIYTAK